MVIVIPDISTLQRREIHNDRQKHEQTTPPEVTGPHEQPYCNILSPSEEWGEYGSLRYLIIVGSLKIGMKRATTMPPMTTPSIEITSGSIRLVRAVTAASTSFS